MYVSVGGLPVTAIWIHRERERERERCILDKFIEIPSIEMFGELNWMKFPDRKSYWLVH